MLVICFNQSRRQITQDDRRELNSRGLASQAGSRTSTGRSTFGRGEKPRDEKRGGRRKVLFQPLTSNVLDLSSPSTGDRNRTCDLLVQSQTQLPTVATPDQVYKTDKALLLWFAKLGEEDSNLYHLIQSQVAYR